MERVSYFIRRLLLIIPTFIGISLVCYAITQFVPGGPVEQAMASMRGFGGAEGLGGHVRSDSTVSDSYRRELVKRFGFDRPFHERYWKWLVTERLGLRMESYKYSNRTAWELISERFPVSLMFGLTGFVLSYLVCIPLGIAKALRHGSRFDLASSVVVFVGYAIPPLAFGMLLKMLLCGTVDGLFDIFPISGYRSDNSEALGAWGQFADLSWHMALPVLCYVIGDFAILTLLMKHAMLDQIGQDYVRTVLAKGGSMQRAVWGHAMRNSLIPIATGFGAILTLMFAGSVVIEQVFEIPGMGKLGLEALVGRDYAVFMGIISVTSILSLLGNVLSDFCYVLIDPRIDFRR
jgi:microcin C transport system permease protein